MDGGLSTLPPCPATPVSQIRQQRGEHRCPGITMPAMTSSPPTLSKSYSQTLFELLREDILCGRRRPKERLVELDIARAHNVSQGPVREALARLREQHLVEYFPNYGSFVATASPAEARDVAEVRRVLEPAAIERALPHLVDEHFELLRGDIENAVAAARARDYPSMFLHDMTFHGRLFAWAESQTLLTFWEHIEATARRFALCEAPKVFASPVEVAQSHYPLLECLRSGDMPGIRDLLDRHIMRIWREVVWPELDHRETD